MIVSYSKYYHGSKQPRTLELGPCQLYSIVHLDLLSTTITTSDFVYWYDHFRHNDINFRNNPGFLIDKYVAFSIPLYDEREYLLICISFSLIAEYLIQLDATNIINEVSMNICIFRHRLAVFPDCFGEIYENRWVSISCLFLLTSCHVSVNRRY